jgi:hypothetical protein
MSTDSKEQSAGPVAGRAATVSPAVTKDHDRPSDADNEASPGAAEDEAQARQRPSE